MRDMTKHRLISTVSRLWRPGRARMHRWLNSSTEVAPGIIAGAGVSGTHNVQFEAPSSVGRGTSFQGYGFSVGRGSTFGIGCVLNGPVRIGRYTQLGSYVGVYGVDHPIDVAVPNVNASFLGGDVKALANTAEVTIGHGCWLGHGAVVLRGVTLGNGCVVGAGSVVTADVPPYSIVVGVPAGTPRLRFDEDLAEGLERLRWWEWSDEELDQHRLLFLTSLKKDPEQARQLIERILQRQ